MNKKRNRGGLFVGLAFLSYAIISGSYHCILWKEIALAKHTYIAEVGKVTSNMISYTFYDSLGNEVKASYNYAPHASPFQTGDRIEVKCCGEWQQTFISQDDFHEKSKRTQLLLVGVFAGIGVLGLFSHFRGQGKKE